jgi:hypothetical protein
MELITIDVGVCTPIEVDLSEYDFTGVEKVIFTVKNCAAPDAEEIIVREFTEPDIHTTMISPQESIMLKPEAKYDFCQVTSDGHTVKVTDTGKIALRKAVGDCIG